MAKVAIRARETLALVRVYEARLIGLETMFWGDEVRDGQGLSIPQAMELGDRESKWPKTSSKLCRPGLNRKYEEFFPTVLKPARTAEHAHTAALTPSGVRKSSGLSPFTVLQSSIGKWPPGESFIFWAT